MIPEAAITHWRNVATWPQDAQVEQDLILSRARESSTGLDAQPGWISRYEQKYEILAMLRGPNGNTGWVRTIWIIPTGEANPRLVTLIPAEKP